MWIYLCSLAAAAQAQETEISVYNRVEHKIDNWSFAIATYLQRDYHEAQTWSHTM